MSRFSNDSLKLDTVEMSGPVVLGGLTDLSHILNSNILAPETGDPYPPSQFVATQQPEIPFTTNALKAVLDEIGLSGLCVTSDGTHDGVVAFQQKHDQCGTNARAASGHSSVKIGTGHIFIEQITATIGQEATATLRVHGVTPDGDTAPQVISYAATLPASKVDDQHYSLGKAQVLSNTVDRITNLTVAYNPQFEKSNDADSIWPTIIDIQQIQTLVTLTTEDPQWLDAAKIPINGKIVAHANTEIYLLQRETTGTPISGGGFKAFATGDSHIKGTLAGLVHITTHGAASGLATGTTEIQIAGLKESATVPIVWDTTANYAL